MSAHGEHSGKGMRITLKIWRQAGLQATGRMES